MTDLALKHGLSFSDLYERDGLIRLDRAFVAHLAATDVGLHARLMAGRADPEALDRKAESDLLVDLAPHVEDFLGELFGIAGEVRALQARHDKLAPLFSVKRLFVQRRAVKEIKEAEAGALNGHKLGEELDTLIGGPAGDFGSRQGALAWELRYAEAVGHWLEDEAAHPLPLKVALQYAAWATLAPDGQARHKRGLLFRVPHRLDMHHLVPVETIERDGVTMLRRPESDWRPRDGFALTDPGSDLAGALDQANYCIWCHNQGKDSCRSGLHEKDGSFKKSVFGVTLAGCPLDEKISEMNLVKARGYSLGALAIVAVDNPICAATGHRICNDCMKACIYQRQEPVDIPQIETRTLKDVLGLPWGFEIYSLLTRWNPLDLRRPLPKPASGYKVLIVGLGPAGFTLAHHPMKNGLVPGVRQASDFLMALQLTGAAKTDSIANLTVRLPVVVIGGGLTAIDTATEALAYYPLQVEKFLARYETLAAERGAEAVRADWNAAEREVAEEFIAHARAIRAEREAAAREGRPPRLAQLIDSWGGVTIAYRRRLIDAPSYTLNHEEVAKAMEEGIRFAECLSPIEVEFDVFEQAAALKLVRHAPAEVGGHQPAVEQGPGEEVVLPARTILVAAGTQPNTVLAREDPEHVALDGRYFRALDEEGNPATPERVAKPAEARVVMSLMEDGRAVSFFGELHPSFAGNVVKAMGGATRGYPVVSRMLAKRAPAAPEPAALKARLDDELRARVHAVERLTPKIVEVVVKAPMAARAFQPGQFYRLQNYEAHAQRVDGTTLAMEGLALTGAWIDRNEGLLSTIVLEMGGSSDLCALLKPGEPVILMGPTGTPTETPADETVLLVGGGLGNAVLFSIGAAFRARGSRVLYFAGYKLVQDRYKIADIERAGDSVVWCCDEAPGFQPGRPQDLAFGGNIVQAIEAYGSGALGPVEIPLAEVDRIIAIGSDGMMNAVGQARRAALKRYFRPGHRAIASINSPMQCMMKEICAQCLQRHYDPATGTETVVFSCFNQDQDLDRVDFRTLRRRLSQNGAQEKLTKLWIDRCLRHLGWRAAEAAE